LATKILFFARDIREGLGERETFKTIIKNLAFFHAETVRKKKSVLFKKYALFFIKLMIIFIRILNHKVLKILSKIIEKYLY
jgi:hypothetical protein